MATQISKEVKDRSKPSSTEYLVNEHKDDTARTILARELTIKDFIELAHMHVSLKVMSAGICVDCGKSHLLRHGHYFVEVHARSTKHDRMYLLGIAVLTLRILPL
jgi:hypothetical protein